jgi:hypothetical protein
MQVAFPHARAHPAGSEMTISCLKQSTLWDAFATTLIDPVRKRDTNQKIPSQAQHMDPRSECGKTKVALIHMIKDPSSCSKPPGVTEKICPMARNFAFHCRRLGCGSFIS